MPQLNENSWMFVLIMIVIMLIGFYLSLNYFNNIFKKSVNLSKKIFNLVYVYF